MQVTRYDGSEEFIQGTMDDLKDKIDDPTVKSVTVHKPGSIITLSGGVQYIVAEDGSWRKLASK